VILNIHKMLYVANQYCI